MKKSIFTSLVLAGTLALGVLTGCGADGAAQSAVESADQGAEQVAEAPATTDSGDKKITVGATPVPHAEILDNIVKEVLAEDGWELETVVFSD